MTLVAVNQMVSGIVRAKKTAEIRATAASLADSAMEYALLSNEAGEINLQETIKKPDRPLSYRLYTVTCTTFGFRDCREL